MHKEHSLQFRAYVPAMIELLEDADGMVRDKAKSVVIELFQYVFWAPVVGETPADMAIGMRRRPRSPT